MTFSNMKTILFKDVLIKLISLEKKYIKLTLKKNVFDL